MNVTRNSIRIAAPAQTIYALAAATERWPDILPHYRYVRVRSSYGATRVVEMAALRDFLPIRWAAEQTNDPIVPCIRFHHIEGWTRGMDVEWTFEPDGEGTRVTIEHRLEFAFPIAAGWLGKHVVSNFFVHHVAGKTLERMKALAERRP